MSKDKIHTESHYTEVASCSRFGIVAARFNAKIVDALLEGAVNTLDEHQVTQEKIRVVRVPGAFEIPLTCQRMAKTQQYDAIIALGCVIRGDTPHFDYVCNESARGILQVGLMYDLPIIYGVLTTDNFEQAQARASKQNNKGRDAAHSALEMLDLLASLSVVD